MCVCDACVFSYAYLCIFTYAEKFASIRNFRFRLRIFISYRTEKSIQIVYLIKNNDFSFTKIHFLSHEKLVIYGEKKYPQL